MGARRAVDHDLLCSPNLVIRFLKDYVKVERMEDLIPLMQKEYGVRMSNQDSDNHRAPSLIRPQGIKIA